MPSFSYLISKMNMDDKALFLTINNGRNDKVKNDVGMFVKTYPFYAEIEGNVKEFLIKCNETQTNNINNLAYPLSDLVINHVCSLCEVKRENVVILIKKVINYGLKYKEKIIENTS